MRGDPSPFELNGSKKGVLCIHGFTGTPFAMRFLGTRLNERGYSVSAPLLAGHGKSPADLNASTWHDWYRSVEEAFDRLANSVDEVAVVGQSLGGLLALRLAQERASDVGAIAVLATPLWLRPLGRIVSRVTRPRNTKTEICPTLSDCDDENHSAASDQNGRAALPTKEVEHHRPLIPANYLPKLGGSDVRDPLMKYQNPSLPVIPVHALHQLNDFMKLVRADLPAVIAPAAIIHSRRDHTAPFASAQEISESVSSKVVRYVPLTRSYHLLSIDVERHVVAAEIGHFLEKHL